MTSATILRIPNEQHMALVREARRRAGLWLPTSAAFVRPIHRIPESRA